MKALDSDGTTAYFDVIVLENQLQSTAQAAATVTIPAGTAATHNLQCSYAGDTNYAASTPNGASITFSTAQTPLFSLHVGSYASAQYVSILRFIVRRYDLLHH